MDSTNLGGSAVVPLLYAIIDPGASLIIGDSTVAQFYSAIPGSANASLTVGLGYTLRAQRVGTVQRRGLSHSGGRLQPWYSEPRPAQLRCCDRLREPGLVEHDVFMGDVNGGWYIWFLLQRLQTRV